MKIIIAHYKYMIQGGPEKYLLKFCELAKRNGNDVIPFSINYPENMDTEYSRLFVSTYAKSSNFDNKNKGIRYYLQGIAREFHNGEAYRKLKMMINAERPDLLYVLIPGELTADIFKAAKESGIPIILRLSDFRLICGSYNLIRGDNICEECIYGKYHRMVKHKCVKNSFLLSLLRSLSLTYIRNHRLYEDVDAVVSPAQFTANLFAQSGFFPKDRIHVNSTFIDCSKYKPYYDHKGYVLCLGRFTKTKGFIYVVRAMRFLKDLDVKVYITGEKTDCDADLQNAIIMYGLEKQVCFIGFLHGEELENVVSNAMCIACPAIWYENLPNVILEAYAYGKPVIASRLGSLIEVVEDGKTGMLFDTKNEEEIAMCIRKLYEDKSLCVKLGEQARKTVEQKYSPEVHWDKFINIYNSIAKSNILPEIKDI